MSRKFLSHRTVMPYSETPPKPVRVRSSSGRKRGLASRIGSGGAVPVPVRRSGRGSIFRPSTAATPNPSFRRWMGQRVARRAETDDEDVLPVVGERVGAPGVERVPAGEQRPDLEAPRHSEDVGQNAGLDLRNVDGVLLLEDAPLHAVVADPVAGPREHRVVDADERQRADRVPLPPERVHLADLLVERTPREGNPEGVGLVAPFLPDESLRAGVLLALLAEDAVEGLAGHLAA